ncbi:MAG TPA: type I secretion protein [Octadecabacter sp.]|nr:type I secretion protein [Octadecabacter sp.]
MPTTYTDQFYLIDPSSPPAKNTLLTFQNYTMTDQNDDGDLDSFDGDSVNGLDITASWPGDTVTIKLGGGVRITYTGTTFNLSDGTAVFTPTDGQILQDGRFFKATDVATEGPLLVGDLGPPCFAAGTLIETERGMTPVQDIEIGDLVRTLDNGLQPVRWRGKRAVAALDERAPIRFAKGAIGNSRELLVSPQHKILVSGWRAEVFFGEEEVLVAAVHLVNSDTIHRAPRRHVNYHHLMFDRHEILLAEGIPTESFYPGEYILQDSDLNAEIMDLFPEMIGQAGPDWETARTVLRSKEVQVFCDENVHVA